MFRCTLGVYTDRMRFHLGSLIGKALISLPPPFPSHHQLCMSLLAAPGRSSRLCRHT